LCYDVRSWKADGGPWTDEIVEAKFSGCSLAGILEMPTEDLAEEGRGESGREGEIGQSPMPKGGIAKYSYASSCLADPNY